MVLNKGYRIRLGSSTEPANNGRLHVDFAHARDDQFEWECKQRQIQREQRHRERVIRENIREETSPGPSHFTESEANSVLDKLKGAFYYAIIILIHNCIVKYAFRISSRTQAKIHS